VSALEELNNGQFGYLTSQTRNAFFAGLDREMQPSGLTAAQFVVVIGAMRYRTRTANDFCQLAGVEPGPMSRLLDRLEAKGIVLRVRGLQDRRQVNITLTEKGAALYPEINARLHKVYRTLLNGFSEQEALALAKATTPSNIIPQLQVGEHEFALVKYLAQQLKLSREEKMAALCHYMPEAKDGDWRLWQAGQRVQIIKNMPDKGGVLKLGTEVVVSADRSVSALLGASPGGSTSPAIMLSLLEKVFPDRVKTSAWQAKIREIVPSYKKKLNEDPQLLAATWASTAETLQLAIASPSLTSFVPGTAPADQSGQVQKRSDIAL